MAIELEPEQEFVIDQAIQNGLIRAADDVVVVGVETIRLRLEALLAAKNVAARNVAAKNVMGADEWSQELHAWVHGHLTAGPLLSDESTGRESIYGTRGE